MEFSALWDSLPYSSPSTPNCSGAPLGGERFRGARFDFWAILAYWCALLWALFGRAINCNPALLSTVMSFRLRAVPLQSVKSKLGRTGESFPSASCFLPFRSLRSISLLAWPSWGTASSLDVVRPLHYWVSGWRHMKKKNLFKTTPSNDKMSPFLF